MVVFNQQQTHDLDSTHWVDFSNQCDNPRNSTFINVAMDGKPQRQHLNDDNMTPPQLTLSFDHYCVIAENVFISFLKSYRSLYSTKVESKSAEKAVKDVAVLGNRLEAFLTVVLPFHNEYGTVHKKRETRRIHDITQQLRDYLEKLTGKWIQIKRDKK
jgi:hypothetical protein